MPPIIIPRQLGHSWPRRELSSAWCGWSAAPLERGGAGARGLEKILDKGLRVGES